MAYDRHLASRSRTHPHRFLEPQGLGGWVSPPQLPLMSALRIAFHSQSVSPSPSPSPPNSSPTSERKSPVNKAQIHHRSESESELQLSSQGPPRPLNSNLSVEWSTVKKDRTATSGAPILIIIILIDCTVILK